MEDKIDKKTGTDAAQPHPSVQKSYDPKNGVTMTWDEKGNCFIGMPVNNIPKAQFEQWMADCKTYYSGKRWDMIMADHIKAKAYDTMLMMSAPQQEIPEEKDNNELGLLNPGM